MKPKILHSLSSVAAGASAIGGLHLTGVLAFLPPSVAGWVTIIPPIVAALGHAAIAIGDQLDDGVDNDSFRCSFFAFACALMLALCCVGCGTTVTTVDGTKTERKPDNETIGLVTGVGLKLAELFAPPKAEPTKVDPSK